MSETLTIILSVSGVNIALISIIAGLIVWSVNKLDTDVNKLDGDIKSLGNRLDGHANRIDQLYRMFVDLLAKKSDR